MWWRKSDLLLFFEADGLQLIDQLFSGPGSNVCGEKERIGRPRITRCSKQTTRTRRTKGGRVVVGSYQNGFCLSQYKLGPVETFINLVYLR